MFEVVLDSLTNLQSFRFDWHGICSGLTGGRLDDLCAAVNSYFSLDQDAPPYGSASSPIAAALATQGYFAQSRIIDSMLSQGSVLFGIAPLLYLLAGIGGLIMLALGSPPKLYLWFLMGPLLYHYILNKRVESTGNVWTIGSRLMPQSEVERLAGIDTGFDDPFQINISFNGFRIGTFGGTHTAKVPWVFAFVDTLVSSAVQGISSTFTPTFTLANDSEEPWYIMSDIKWDLLETITSAKISNADVRDILNTFLFSECGTVLKQNLNYALYLAARNAKNSTPPDTVMFDWDNFVRELESTSVPVPRSLKGLLGSVYNRAQNQNPSPNTPTHFLFQESVLGINVSTTNLNVLFRSPEVKCNVLAAIIAASIRADAGYTFANLMSKAPLIVPSFIDRNPYSLGSIAFKVLLGDIVPMTPSTLFHTMFGTWKGFERTFNNSLNLGPLRLSFGNLPIRVLGGLNHHDEAFATSILTDLITAYIFKNELAFAPALLSQQGSNPDETVRAGLTNISSVGSRSKFAEVYVWGKMIPHVQGLFLYWLALAFPIAVLLMVLPNFHKALITWSLFWIWVKSWDIGFLLIKRIERVLWAMIGSSDYLLDSILQASKFSSLSKVVVGCFDPQGISTQGLLPPCIPGTVPIAFVRSGNYETTGAGITMLESAKTIDLGLALSNTFWLEEGNAFYLYLMAAMYFAVPVIMGQLILGSKAAMANLVKDFIGQPTQEAAKAAGSAYSAQRQAQASATSATFNQQEMLKNMRADGLAARAIASQNIGLANKFDAALSQQIASGIDAKTNMMDLGIQRIRANLDAEKSRNLLAFQIASAMDRTQSALGLFAKFGVTDFVLSNQNAGSSDINLKALHEKGEKVMTPLRGGINSAVYTMRNAAEALNQAAGIGNSSNDSGVSQAEIQHTAQNADGRISIPQVANSAAASFIHPGINLAVGTMQNVATAVNQATGIVNSSNDRGVSQAKLQHIAQNADGRISVPQVANAAAASFIHPIFYGTVQGLTSLFETANALIQPAYMDQKANFTAISRGWGINSFELSQLGTGRDEEARRLQAAAQFAAQDTTWLARADYANAVSATLAAYGVSPTTVSPGEKPTEMLGGAWLGQLGENAAQEARFVDSRNSNSFFTRVVSQTDGLRFNYGVDALQTTYSTIKTQTTTESLIGLAIINSNPEQRLNFGPIQAEEAFKKSTLNQIVIQNPPPTTNFKP